MPSPGSADATPRPPGRIGVSPRQTPASSSENSTRQYRNDETLEEHQENWWQLEWGQQHPARHSPSLCTGETLLGLMRAAERSQLFLCAPYLDLIAFLS